MLTNHMPRKMLKKYAQKNAQENMLKKYAL